MLNLEAQTQSDTWAIIKYFSNRKYTNFLRRRGPAMEGGGERGGPMSLSWISKSLVSAFLNIHFPVEDWTKILCYVSETVTTVVTVNCRSVTDLQLIPVYHSLHFFGCVFSFVVCLVRVIHFFSFVLHHLCPVHKVNAWERRWGIWQLLFLYVHEDVVTLN